MPENTGSMRLRGISHNRTLVIALVGAFLSLWATKLAHADTYAPLGKAKYVCSQTGATAEDPVGRIKIHLRNKKLIAGRKGWNYAALNKQINKLSKSKKASDKKTLKTLRKTLNLLLECYDTRSLPRPGSGTPGNPGGTPTPVPGTITFDTIRPILEANCMGCHSTRGWVMSEQYFLESDLVQAGNASESPLYRYLRNNPEGYIPASMPVIGDPLAADQIAAIRSWINSIGVTPTPTPPPGAGPFTCLPSVQIAPSKMKRLSKTQILNSLYDLLYAGFNNTGDPQWFVYGATWSERSALSDDYNHLGHGRLDDRLDETRFEAIYRLFEQVVTTLHNGNGLWRLVNGYVPNCDYNNYQSESCRNEFLRRFGRRVLKGMLSQADYDFYRRPNGSGVTQADYREMLLRLFSSPEFLFHLEERGAPVDSTGLLLQISAKEFIHRLAYTVWNTIPDNQLITFAENGMVDQDPAAVVSYVLDQQASKSREGFKDFFEGWFKVAHSTDEIGRYFEVDGVLPQFLPLNYGTGAQPLVMNPNDENERRDVLRLYRDDLNQEILEIGSLLTFSLNAPVSELFRTRIAPVRSESSRRNYALPAVWDGNPANIPLAPAAHAGVLARPAFHLSRGDRNRPIIAGRRVREDILCDPTGLPANNSTPPGINTNSAEYRYGTTQHRTRMLTEAPGTSCGGCHQPYLNPLGFALEDFDSLGRYRDGNEYVLDGNGNYVARQIDRTVVPRVNRQDTTPVTGTAGLSERIADSDEMHACFTKNMVRFALNRVENEGGDGCFMNELFTDAKNLPMKEVLRRMFLNPLYRLRRLNAAH